MRFSLLNPSVLTQQQRSPWYFAITLVLSVFFAETLVMIGLNHLPEMPLMVEALCDATALSILIMPSAYFFIFRPFVRHMEVQAHIETELRRSQEQSTQRLQELTQAIATIQTEKMSGLSQMVAGVAHELNNPVTFIHSNLVFVQQYVQTLLDVIEQYQQHHQQYGKADAEIQAIEQQSELKFVTKDLRKILSSMHNGSDRIRQIVLDLRTFSRMGEAALKPVDIHQGTDSALSLLQNRLNPPGLAAIQVIKEYSELPLISCNGAQLNQVVMNILNNAIDALSGVPNPTIWVRTQIKIPGWVSIMIEDNGVGIPEAVMPKVFDPFFTTKCIGEGTGLGLAISYQIIVNNHGGSLRCISEAGKGTEFWIEIPVG
jgi:two-component system, NtrC family, sensor kinase